MVLTILLLTILLGVVGLYLQGMAILRALGNPNIPGRVEPVASPSPQPLYDAVQLHLQDKKGETQFEVSTHSGRVPPTYVHGGKTYRLIRSTLDAAVYKEQ